MYNDLNRELLEKQSVLDLITDMELINFTAKGILRNRIRTKTQKYKEESPEEIAADMALISPFEPETWCSLLKGLNRAGYIICKKI